MLLHIVLFCILCFILSHLTLYMASIPPFDVGVYSFVWPLISLIANMP